jgi:hypothetical protein
MADLERPLPLATAMTWSSSRLGTRLTVTTGSLSLGEHCTDIVALVRHAPPGDGEPSATAVIALRRVMVFPDPAPLS